MKTVANIPEWLLYNPKDITVPEWIAPIKQKHRELFFKTGLPTNKDERWKYTDLSFLTQKKFAQAKRKYSDDLYNVMNQHRLQRDESIMLVLVNGYFAPELSDMAKLPEALTICTFQEALVTHAELFKTFYSFNTDQQKYPFANLNTALCLDGLFIYLPEQYELTTPIHLLSIVADEDEFIAHPHHMIMLSPNSKLTLVEEYFSLAEHAYMMNIVMTTFVDKGAQFTHYKIQQEGKEAIHMAHHFIHQMQDSRINVMNFSFGAHFSRDDLAISLHEPGAECSARGFYHLRRQNQYVDHHVDIDHKAPCSNSEMIYKGIIDHQSRAVFNGRLHVLKNAQKIVAHQANHNLLLSHQAEIYSKPELEIYADDVKCKHGATTGQVDQDALFYLCSRGISREEAMEMLLQGFAEEIIQGIFHRAVKMRVQEMVV